MKRRLSVKFKVGDKVKISKSSPFYRDNDPSNPRDVVGVVKWNASASYATVGDQVFVVSWRGGVENDYRGIDLELAEEEVFII